MFGATIATGKAALSQSIESGTGPDSLLSQSRQHTLLSSIGGFSRPTSKRIHTLEDLLHYVQSLGLTAFSSSQIEKTALLGQGASYKVFGCKDRRSGSTIAVKRVKLPSSSANFEAFENRVTCVLRDVEVMHHAPLARHKNIIQLLGYGWDYEQGDTIPFLVTELAHQGTLRQYLSERRSLSLKDRLELCGDVIGGLYEIHLCGVCHGDVKLDNVLVSSPNGQVNGRTLRPIAKISDFGHSIMLSSKQASVSQYRGTVGYAPPETYIPDVRSQAVDVRMCDLWALGLACWEVLAHGVPYYETAIVQEALSTTISATTSPDLSGSTPRSEGNSGSSSKLRNLEKLYELNSRLSLLVQRFTETSVFDLEMYPDQQQKWSNSFFSGLLNPDPFKRSALVIHYPLFYDNCIPIITSSRQQLIDKDTPEREWSFEIFKPSRMSLTPASAKKRIFQDFRLIVTHKDPVQASRAKLHVAYAYATGFGIEQNLTAFRISVNKCAANGLQIVTSLQELFTQSEWLHSGRDSLSCYTFFVRSLLKRLVPAPKLDSADAELSYESLEIAASKAAQALGAAVIPASTFAVHYNLTHQIPYDTLVNEQHPTTGETALATACRLGDYQATLNLLDRGANPSIRDHCGCLPLHWLCMFEDRHVEFVALRLTQNWGFQNINCKSTAPRVPDVQCPVVLHGTALAFAVTMCSFRAVKALLAVGADPSCGFANLDTEWGDRSAITIAVCLHLVDILCLLWPDQTSPLPSAVVLLPCALPNSSCIERYLIHGERRHSAMKEMIQFLGKALSYYVNHEVVSYAPMEAAVAVLDLDIAENLLWLYYNSHQEAKNQLFRVCINMACKGTLDWKDSTSLLDFALQFCNINACFVPDGRAIDILIERRQGRLLQDWLIRKNPEMSQLVTDRSFSPVYDMIDNGLSNVVPIESLLSRGAYPNIVKPERGHTALHLAIERHLVDDVRTLLKHGANPLIVDETGTSAFHLAVYSGNIMLLNEILPFVQDVNVLGNDDKSALYAAARLNLTEVVTLLLQYGARSRVDEDPQTPLHVAAASGHIGPLIPIIKSGQNVDLENGDGITPLLLAIQSLSCPRNQGYFCITALLDAGASPNAHGPNLEWPVHMVFRHSRGRERLDLIHKLHEVGADLDVCRSDGTSLLHLAAFACDIPMVQYLLNAGASPSLRGNHDQTPLHDCVRSIPTQSHGVISHLDVEITCRIVISLADAGRKTPFKPHARHDTSARAEGAQVFDRSPGTQGDSVSENARIKGRGLLKKWREQRAAENRKEIALKENTIAGHGVTLFRDATNRTALELAALRTTDQDVLKVLLEFHREYVVEQSGTENIAIQDGEPIGPAVDNGREHLIVIDAAWRAAVDAENWPAVLQFLTNGVPLILTPLRWPHGGRLLEYAIVRYDPSLLKLFMGDDVPMDSSQALPTDRADWPKFPNLSREFGVDLYYLWEVTREVRRDRVLGDDTKAYCKRASRGGDASVFAWEKCATITIDSKSWAKAREKIFLSYEDLQAPGGGPCFDHPLRQMWLHVQAMDFQTSNFYFGTGLHAPSIKSDLKWWAVKQHLRSLGNDNKFQSRLLQLVGISFLHAGQSPAWNPKEAYWNNPCFPDHTSIPIALVHDVAADPHFNAHRAQRLCDMIHNYRDLVSVIGCPEFIAHVIAFETIGDRDWYEETTGCLRDVLRWVRELYGFEVGKRGAMMSNESVCESDELWLW